MYFLAICLYSQSHFKNCWWKQKRGRLLVIPQMQLRTKAPIHKKICRLAWQNTPPPLLWLTSIHSGQVQRAQNSAARLVMKSHKCHHVQPLLRSLHWLPVHSRTDYKISALCFNTFTDSSPVYIAQLLSAYTPSRHLHSSSDTRTLHIPFVESKSFGRSIFLPRPNSMEFTALWTPNLLLHLKQLSKPISSDLRTNLRYLLDGLCVCVHVHVHAPMHADPIIVVFVPGVAYGFLCVYNVMWELSTGIFFNIVGLINSRVFFFFARVINVFICMYSYCKARCAEFC